jgi:hypothetical protein
VDTLEKYMGEFDEAGYLAAMHNPLLDGTFLLLNSYMG